MVEAFPKARSVSVLGEDLRFAPDLLWCFVQLQPQLRVNPALMAITGLNDNGLAPCAANSTVALQSAGLKVFSRLRAELKSPTVAFLRATSLSWHEA